MQTLQGQPPQYTLPVVSPHLAPPARPDVKEGYKSCNVRRLATAQVALGCLAFGFQLWDTINYSYLSVAGTGMWSGVFFVVTGCLGLASANQKTVCSIVSYMVTSIFSSILAIGLLVVSSINLSYYDNCTYDDWFCRNLTDYMKTCTYFLSIMLVFISVAEGFMSVISASLACHGCCCSNTNQRLLSYTDPVQYVQGSNGQLLLITGQQNNLVTTTTGQQVLVAVNSGCYQTLGLPVQGNYQTPGSPAQPYMTTVPTMPIQQPMPQPDSVQPPAYQTVAEQAAGTQQPQVHQSAANNKTNTGYVHN